MSYPIKDFFMSVWIYGNNQSARLFGVMLPLIFSEAVQWKIENENIDRQEEILIERMS